MDEFTDRDLVIAEVELPSEDVRPKIPRWLAPYVVREVTGDERRQWWERAVEVFPNYAEYQERTERVIPVLVAERVA